MSDSQSFPEGGSGETTWEPADLEDVSLIEVEQDGIEYQISVVMMGNIDRAVERAFRDQLIADHTAARQLAVAKRALEDWADNFPWHTRKCVDLESEMDSLDAPCICGGAERRNSFYAVIADLENPKEQ